MQVTKKTLQKSIIFHQLRKKAPADPLFRRRPSNFFYVVKLNNPL